MGQDFIDTARWVAAYATSPYVAVVQTPSGCYAVQSRTPIPLGVALPELAADFTRRLLGALRPGTAASPALPPYTLREAAALLTKSGPWLRRRAKAGHIPGARKVGKSWVFDRVVFDHWRARPEVG